jgi:hypothetical protein
MRPDPFRRSALIFAVGAAIVLLAGAGMPSCTAAEPAQALPELPSQCGRLSTRGIEIVCRDGTRFEWRGVTAFALLEQIAHGRRRDADAYMRWAHATGFNLVRVLAMADVLFTLAPDEGLRHMPSLVEMAALRGLYVEIVALADTASYRMDLAALRAQVSAVSRLAADHPNVVVQIANEHYHPTQVPEVHDPAVLTELGRLVAPQVLYTESPAAEEAAARPAGRYLTRHLSRSGSPASMLDRVEILGRLAAETGKPVVNDEPIGAGERDEPGRRLSDPGFFRDLASRTRAAGLAGGTFHCEDGLFARVPGPIQQACARAWVEGASVSGSSTPRRP